MNMRISTIKQRGGHKKFQRCEVNEFWFPHKPPAAPTITPHFSGDSVLDKVVVDCSAGIAQIEIINGNVVKIIDYDSSKSGNKTTSTILDLDEIDRSMPLYLGVVGCDGQSTRLPGVWKPTHGLPVRINDSDIILNKQSVLASADDWGHQWAVMLNEKGPDGKLSRANMVVVHVGAVLGGATVHYEDGHTTPCGHRHDDDGCPFYAPGACRCWQTVHIPQGVDIVKVEVKTWGPEKYLGGIYMTLSDGSKAGVYNTLIPHEIKVMEAGPGEKIVGFYGTSRNYAQEFGIITGPKDVELPPQTYDMPELQNIQADGRRRD